MLIIRAAKRKLDDWSFYGGVLHVCYAPEYETVQETKEKLQDRRKAIAAKVRQYGEFVITETPCNIHIFLTAGKFFDIFLIFTQNIDCGYMLEPRR